MSETLRQVYELVSRDEYLVSAHALDELAKDNLVTTEVIEGVSKATVVEDYPAFGKGPCVLVRQTDKNGQYIHALWGLRKGTMGPAVLVTCYRPDPQKWSPDLLRRL